MNGRERPRGYPPTGAPVRDRERDRRAADPRNASNPMAPPAPGGMSRAEKFEDEKRRLVQSCFSKRDTDGSINESYITHIRITEDAAYPSGPAPPNSPLENKKPRLIIVSVKKSGRVRMHKSRENSDGTFSIGKTWMLDDLSRIQTFEHMVPSSQTEQQQKMWASNLGFTVTITKPYYWQAATQKERDFFIGSLVKIFKKYTGGKVPELVNFDPRERELIAGAAAASPQPRQTPRNQQQAPRPKSPSQPPPTQPTYAQRAPSREPARDPRKQPSREQFLRDQASQDDMQRNRPRFPPPKTSQDVVPPTASQPKPKEPSFGDEPSPATVPQQRSRPAAMAPSPVPPQLSSGISTPQSNEHLTPALRPQPSEEFSRPGSSKSRTAAEPPVVPNPTVVPNRKPVSRDQSPARPLFQQPSFEKSNGDLGRPTPNSDVEDRFVTPFSSPEPKPDDLRPTSRGSNKSINKLEASITQRLAPSPAREISPKSHEEPPSNAIPPVPVPAPLQPKTESEITRAAPLEPEPEPEPKAEPVPEPVSPPSATSETPAKTSTEESHRPGLGPMVKKKSAKDVASTFRKAANAYGAFKPRIGGAAERLMAAKEKEKAGSDEPDGITGVVPAPLLRGASHETTKSATPDTSVKDTASTVSTKQETAPPPKVEVTAVPAEPSSEAVQKDIAAEVSTQKSTSTQAERRRQRREDNRAKYCSALGIDALILDDRGMDFDEIMTDLGWDGKLSEEQKIEDLEVLVRREIGRVQASSWLGHLELQEGKIEQLAKLFDNTIAECDELDGLLTLYSHELNTLADDVAHIEAQSQGLQVQTANQKLLQSELQNLLKTISISSSDLRALREASLSNPDGVKDTEASLATLYKAMVTIDSDMRQNKKRFADKSGDRGGVGIYADTDIGQMRAVKEKMGQYRNEAEMFLQRLKQYMGLAFKIAEQKLVESNTGSGTKLLRIDSGAHDFARQELWMYGPLMLFAREVSTSEWAAITSLYELQFKQPYQNEFRDNAMTWKREARKPTGDEQELLFTHQEKDREGEGITTAARKLTVRRGKTVRHTGPSRLTPAEHQDGKVEPFEAFAGSLDETTKLISEEQNFMIQFFHLNSISNVEFPDLIVARSPENRRLDVRENQPYDPDREMAKKVEQAMGELFPSWVMDTQNFAEWTLKADPLQGVGVLFSLEKKLSFFEETNQEFILRGLQKIHSRFMALFNRFVDEQVRGIEETKVKIKKRKGVISFMKVFPHFSATIENMIATPSDETYDIRFSVNDAYSKINRAMWDSLKFIAKEAPGQQSGPAGGVGDPEDKEALNYHIMLIENMNHYVEEVDNRDNIILMEWQDRAVHDMNEHLRLYIDAVIRRPIGKLLDFIESTESLLQTASSPTDIALRPSHSRPAVRKLLASYDLRELRRGIDALKKRVEKHFGEGDDPGLSRSLVVKVLKECEARFSGAHDRMARIIELVYENRIDMEWRKEEAAAMFKR